MSELESKLCVVSDIESKNSQPVRFIFKIFTTCQTLHQNFHNASVPQLNNYNVSHFESTFSQHVRFWIKILQHLRFRFKILRRVRTKSKLFTTCQDLGEKFYNDARFWVEKITTCQILKQISEIVKIWIKILESVRFRIKFSTIKKNYNMSKILSWILKCCYNFLKLFTKCRKSIQKFRGVIFWIENFTTCQTLNQNNYNVSEIGSTFYKVADFEIKALERVGLSSQLFTSCQKLQAKFYNDINVLN